MNSRLIVLGWREWLALPELGIGAIKAKVDTGARSSSLHVEALEEFVCDNQTWVRFTVAPQGQRNHVVTCTAPGITQRMVTDSGGHSAERWFIRTLVRLAGQCWDVEINLTNRRNMLFPMLLGRTALHNRFVVDSALSYCCGHITRRIS